MHNKSTSGLHVEIQGPSGRSMPMSPCSQTHPGTSPNTPESDLVTLARNLRNEMLPVQMFLQQILGTTVKLIAHQDIEACIMVAKKGYSPSMRCHERNQRASIGVCHDTFREPVPKGFGESTLIYASTKLRKCDLNIKYLDGPALGHTLQLLDVRPYKD